MDPGLRRDDGSMDDIIYIVSLAQVGIQSRLQLLLLYSDTL